MTNILFCNFKTFERKKYTYLYLFFTPHPSSSLHSCSFLIYLFSHLVKLSVWPEVSDPSYVEGLALMMAVLYTHPPSFFLTLIFVHAHTHIHTPAE